MRKTKLFLAALTATIFGLTTLSHADTLSDIKQRKKVLVGIDLTFPPFGMLDGNLKPIGSDVSAAKMLATARALPALNPKTCTVTPRAFAAA